MSGSSLAAEREGTDLRTKWDAERQDAAVWGRGPFSDRLGPPDGDADTSGTEPDHALWWKRDVSLQEWTQDVRAVH